MFCTEMSVPSNCLNDKDTSLENGQAAESSVEIPALALTEVLKK